MAIDRQGLQAFILLVRMKSRSDRYPTEPTLPQNRVLSMHVQRCVKEWHNPDRAIKISYMRHYILSALLGRTITSQKEITKGEHIFLIDLLEKEPDNGVIYDVAEYIEEYAGTLPADIFQEIDGEIVVPDLSDAVEPRQEHRHARSHPHEESREDIINRILFQNQLF